MRDNFKWFNTNSEESSLIAGNQVFTRCEQSEVIPFIINQVFDLIAKLATDNISATSSNSNSHRMVVEHKPTVSIEVTTMKFKNMGKMVRSTLLRAKSQKRIIFGLSEAIKMLSKKPNESLFCFLAPVKNDDSATHMHEVLLQAFCLENDIYIIKVCTPSTQTHMYIYINLK